MFVEVGRNGLGADCRLDRVRSEGKMMLGEWSGKAMVTGIAEGGKLGLMRRDGSERIAWRSAGALSTVASQSAAA